MESIMYALVGFGLGLFGFYYGFARLQLKRLIETTPTSTVRSIAMGTVEVQGIVAPAKKTLLTSPLSGKPCVYYAYAVEEYRSSGKHSRWVTIRSGSKGTPFFARDKTGSVLVDPQGAKIEIPKDIRYGSRLGRDPPKSVQKFLKTERIPFESFFGMNKTMRFTESYIAPEDTLYVLGYAQDNPHVEEGTGQKNEEDIVIGKGGRVFFISDKPEKDILKTLSWNVYLFIYGGAALSLACLAVILIYFGLF